MEELLWAHSTIDNIFIDYVRQLDSKKDEEYIKLVIKIKDICKKAIREQIYHINER